MTMFQFTELLIYFEESTMASSLALCTPHTARMSWGLDPPSGRGLSVWSFCVCGFSPGTPPFSHSPKICS